MLGRRKVIYKRKKKERFNVKEKEIKSLVKLRRTKERTK